jgi:hypothetical protein
MRRGLPIQADLINVPHITTLNIKSPAQWNEFLSRCSPGLRADLRERATPDEWMRDTGAVEIETLVAGAGILVVGTDDIAPSPVPERARDVLLQPGIGPVEIPGEAPAVVVEDVAAVLAADDGPGRPAERVHPGLDRDPIGVLDRRVVGDEETRAVVEEDAFAAPERVVLHGRARDVIGAVHRIDGAVLKACVKLVCMTKRLVLQA